MRYEYEYNMSTKDYNDKKWKIIEQRIINAISPVISWLECAKWILRNFLVTCVQKVLW